MIPLEFHPSVRQLRQFSLAALVLLPLLGWLFSGRPTAATWTEFHTALIGSLAALGAVVALLAFWIPAAVRPVYIAVMLITFPIGLVISELLLLLVWLLLFVPLATIFRLVGRDALDRQFDRSSRTYWRPKRQPPSIDSYFRQS
jgi:hypothetical protein